MGKSILNDKWILVVDNNPDFLFGLEGEIRKIAPNCHCDKATHYKKASELLASYTYDLIILDIMIIQSSNLLNRAVNRFPPAPVVLLTSPYIDSEALKGFMKMGIRVCSTRENFREMVPFMEDAVRYEDFPRWRRLLEDLTRFFRGKIKTGWQQRSRFEMKSVGGAGSIS